MIEDIKNFKINWIDGMKISKAHFQSLQNFAENSVKDAFVTRKGRYGYGFLATYLDGNNDYAINLDLHKKMTVTIPKLRAITPNGNRIEISGETPDVIENIDAADLLTNKGAEIFMLINLDPANPVAFGEQDPKEVPPRFPFLTNGHFFTFVDADELENTGLTGNQLPIAKISNDDNTLNELADYIPPSTSLGAHSQLIEFYNAADRFLTSAEQNTVLIARKVKSKQSENPIADAMYIAVDKIYPYLAQQITKVRWERYDMHPKDLLEIIVSFARLFKGAVDMSPAENKEMLFNYFGEWTDKKGGAYEKLFTDVINMEYRHLDVNENLKTVSDFMTIISKLFTVLTQVDYIGKRRDMGIFVHENVVKEKTKKSETSETTSGPSFLAE